MGSPMGSPMKQLRWLPLLVIALALAAPLAFPRGDVARAAGLGRSAQSQSDVMSAAHVQSATTGVIRGQVVNGAQNNAPVVGQSVILQLSVGTTTHDLQTAKTDSQGHFTFTEVDPTTDSSVNYAVYTHYQGGVYSTDPIQLKAGATQQTQLVVYTATQNPANLSVSVVTILFRDIDQQHALHGLASVGEFVTIQNSGKMAFVGSFAQPASGGMPGALRFALPASATNLTTGVGFFNTQIIQLNGGFAATATVPPGQTQFAFSFDSPYSGTTLALPYIAQYPTAQVVALVPPDILVKSSPGLQAQGQVVAFSSRYQVFTANKLTAQQQVSVNLYALPQAGQQPDLDFTQLIWLVVALAMIIAILLVFYLQRGDLAVALGLVPARAIKAERAAQANAKRMNAAERETERKRLLRRLLTLDKAHDSGALTDGAFRQQRAETRAALKALLALDTPVANTAKPTPKPATATVPAAHATPGEPSPTSGATDDMTNTATATSPKLPQPITSAVTKSDGGEREDAKQPTKQPTRRTSAMASTIGKRASKSTPTRVLSGGHR